MLAREHDNFRAALGWSLPEDGETGPRLARALGGFWLARGFLQEGQDWLERALATAPPDPRLRADLLRLLGTILVHVDPVAARRPTPSTTRVTGSPRRPTSHGQGPN